MKNVSSLIRFQIERSVRIEGGINGHNRVGSQVYQVCSHCHFQVSSQVGFQVGNMVLLKILSLDL